MGAVIPDQCRDLPGRRFAIFRKKKKIADAQSNLLSVKQWKMFSISMSQVVFGIYLYIKNTCGLSESQINRASCILSGSPPRQGLRSLL